MDLNNVMAKLSQQLRYYMRERDSTNIDLLQS